MSRWPVDYRLELEAFWRSHHEAWRRSDLNQKGILRGAWPAVETVRELAGEVQGGAGGRWKAAVPARWHG